MLSEVTQNNREMCSSTILAKRDMPLKEQRNVESMFMQWLKRMVKAELLSSGILKTHCSRPSEPF